MRVRFTLEAGSGRGVGGPAALHEAQEACTGCRSKAWHSTQVWTDALHHLHHDLKDVVLSWGIKESHTSASAQTYTKIYTFQRRVHLI